MWQCSYNAYRSNKPVVEKLSAACYSGEYSDSSVTKYEVFVPRQAQTPENDKKISNRYFSDRDIIIYCNLLKRMGFRFSFTSNSTRKINCSYYSIKELGEFNSFMFTINTEENSSPSNLILLNAFRYLYEGNFYLIVKNFLELASNKSCEMLLFNKFILAHYAVDNYNNSNHSFRPDVGFICFYTKDKYKEIILDYKNQVKNLKEYLPVASKNTSYNYDSNSDNSKYKEIIAYRSNLERIINSNITLKEKEEKYIELCEKYM